MPALMSTAQLFKDRNFLAVIGDEVHRLPKTLPPVLTDVLRTR